MQKSRTDRPQILLDIGGYVPELGGVLEPIVELAKRLGWRFINLRHTRDVLPDGISLDGAIINAIPDSPLALRLLQMRCPAVRVGVAVHPKDDLVPAILPDLDAMGKLAANHFADRNFRHVGYIRNTPWGKSRTMHESFGARAEQLGLQCHSLQIQRPPSGVEKENIFRTYGDSQTSDWLRSVPKPIGVLCYSDVLAGRLCFMCQSLGFAVPEDVAIIGYGDTIDCRIAPVTLSSIIPNHQKTADQAVNVLKCIITGKSVSTRTFVEPKGIIERHSTNVLAVSDPVLAKAIRYLWDNFDSPITVEDVVRDINTSRSTLERTFRKHLGRGVKAELQRKRLANVAELLLSTDMTISEIALASGLNNLSHVHKIFLKQFGMTPRQFRLEKG